MAEEYFSADRWALLMVVSGIFSLVLFCFDKRNQECRVKCHLRKPAAIGPTTCSRPLVPSPATPAPQPKRSPINPAGAPVLRSPPKHNPPTRPPAMQSLPESRQQSFEELYGPPENFLEIEVTPRPHRPRTYPAREPRTHQTTRRSAIP